jgi:hypothetical protein
VDDLETQIWAALRDQTTAAGLRDRMFGSAGLLTRYLPHCTEKTNTTRVQAVVDEVYRRLADLDRQHQIRADAEHRASELRNKQEELKRSEWDEFKSKACTDWKRVRTEIEHENSLVNPRLNWLFTSQIFLMGGFAAVFQASLKEDLLSTSLPVQVVLLAIAGVAISVCLFIMVCVDAAFKHMQSLENWGFAHYLSKSVKLEDMLEVEKLVDHPPINGIFEAWLYFLLNSKWLPIPIIAGWLGLTSAVWFEKVLNYQQPVVWTVSVSAGALLLGVLLWKALKIPRKRTNREVGEWRKSKT